MIKSIKKRPTLADVAAEARLSVPTVDRVLNARAPVRAETARRVQEAAARIGYHAAPLIGRRSEALQPARTLGFLIQRRAAEFYRNFAAELAEATVAPELGAHLPLIEHMEDLTPAAVAERILKISERCDALGVVAADHPKVIAAVERVWQAESPSMRCFSDLSAPSRAGYFGLLIIARPAARRAGRWRGSRSEPGKVAIVVGNHRYLGHEWAEMSFRGYFANRRRGSPCRNRSPVSEDPASPTRR